MDVVWITDPHLNFVPHPEAFGAYVAERKPGAVLITGDIAEVTSLARCLVAFKTGLGSDVPVWFVLGNHDAYSGSVELAKTVAEALTDKYADLIYLGSPKCSAIELCAGNWLVGVDGWYDAAAGLPFESTVELSDFSLVAEMCVTRTASGRDLQGARVGAARRLAQPEAELAKTKLAKVLRKKPKRVVFATHVPPYAEATFNEGRLSNANWVPWFSNLCLGKVLAEAAAAHPEVEFEVYCGHTHSSGTYKKAPNLIVRVGAAKYAVPDVAGTLRFEEGL